MISKEDPNASEGPSPPSEAPHTRRTPTVDVRDLVGEGREALIRHNGEFYRLRITAAGKLILTK